MRAPKTICLVVCLLCTVPALCSGKKDVADGAKSVSVIYSAQERATAASLSGFSAYKRRFDSVLLGSLAESGDGNYYEAAREFVTPDALGVDALSLGAAQVSPQVLARLDPYIQLSRDAVPQVRTLQRSLDRPYSQLMEAIASGDADGAAVYARQVQQSLEAIARERNAVLRAGQGIAALFDELSAQGGVDASYVFLLSKLVCGLDGTRMSGLCGVYDRLWGDYMAGARVALEQAARGASRQYASVAGQKDFLSQAESQQAAREAVSSAAGFADLALSLSRLDDLLDANANSAALRDGQYTARMDQLAALCGNASRMLDAGGQYALLQQGAALVSAPQDDVAFARGGDSYAEGAVSFATSVSALWQVVSAIPGECDAPGWDEAQSAYQKSAAALKDSCSALAVQSWTSAANWFERAGFLLVQDDREAFYRASTLLPSLDGEAALGSRQYPREAIAQMEQVASSITGDIALLSRYGAYLDGDAAQSFASSVQAQRQSVAASEADLRSLLGQSAAVSRTATELTSRAYQAQLDGDALYRDAEAAYRRRDYDGASQKLEAAAEKYDESLALQDDPELRQKRDTSLLDLSNRIARAKYENIVRDVRTLKDRATTLYYSGEFEDAEAALSQAEQLWTSITVEPDDELERLKTLVNTALTMNIGRVLSPDDPLYPEMSQILSAANQYYSEGLQRTDSGDGEGARDLLNRAKSKLEELQRVYPLNQAANLLTLRINRLLDPVDFERVFAARVAELSRVNYAARDSAAMQSYTELKDLYIISPSYPGVAAAITEAEYALGLRQRPVAVSSSQRAATLAREAASLVSRAGDDPSLLAQAEQVAQSALELDPNNAAAKNVLDEVKLRSGSQDSGVLSSEDEELFQRAKTLFKNNFIEEAHDIIVQLSARNASSKRVKNLRERIELKL